MAGKDRKNSAGGDGLRALRHVLRAATVVFTGCFGGFILVFRCMLGTGEAGEPLPERALGDPLVLDSSPQASQAPTLRFQAAREGYYVLERLEDGVLRWLPVEVITEGPGELNRACPGNEAHTHAVFRLAEYPRNAPADCDGDGMNDVWEAEHALKPLDASDAALDADGDGRSNLEEAQQGTCPTDDDTTQAAPQILHPAEHGTIVWIP